MIQLFILIIYIHILIHHVFLYKLIFPLPVFIRLGNESLGYNPYIQWCRKLSKKKISFTIGSELRDFTLELASQFDSTSGDGDFRLCATYSGAVGDGLTVSVACTGTGRYVRLKLPRENARLSICEIQVTGKRGEYLHIVLHVHVH